MTTFRRLYYLTYRHRRPLAVYGVLAMIILPAIIMVLVIAAESIPAAIIVSCLFVFIGMLVRFALRS